MVTQLAEQLSYNMSSVPIRSLEHRGGYLLRVLREITIKPRDGRPVDDEAYAHVRGSPGAKAQLRTEWQSLLKLSDMFTNGTFMEYNVRGDGCCWLWAVLSHF
eukprot:2818918-Pleurochrysis_carterae.AAC.1